MDSFNPRTRDGCDGRAPVNITEATMFQSTHP